MTAEDYVPIYDNVAREARWLARHPGYSITRHAIEDRRWTTAVVEFALCDPDGREVLRRDNLGHFMDILESDHG